MKETRGVLLVSSIELVNELIPLHILSNGILL